ncbi:Hypothetical protein SMAX5B_003628 [Scophthalmus maximus]|uniref:Protein FAM163B n=1 Tax=Scophthalmus maximus TaxID=52904 RepID=A0A2U9CHB3_SCOMX|nr:Hypothetical protein SMAX5B_003628 [Scophthalmus maximus]
MAVVITFLGNYKTFTVSIHQYIDDILAVSLTAVASVLCYCRLQYYCCKKEESESEEEEPDFAVTSRLPPVHSNHNIVAATAAASSIPNGPALFSTPPLARKLTRSQTFCPSCTHYELPFYLQPPPPQIHHQPDGLRNGGDRISYRSVQQQDLDLPVPVNISNYRKPNLARSVTMRDMFTRSCSISTDV